MDRCIVCGIDASTGSRHAAPIAARLARDLGSRAVLVHVVGAGGVLSHLRFGRARRTRGTLRAVADEHAFPRGTRIRVKVGDAANTLMLLADREDAELVVVGAGGESSASAYLLGHVSSTLMHRAPCPVVVVPSDAIAPLDAEGMRSVVCGIAGDETDP